MFELEQYIIKDHFFYSSSQDLTTQCNAPKDGAGVYLVHTLQNGKIKLVYVGASGKILQNGNLRLRQGGMFDRLVNGKQFGSARKVSWKKKLEDENIDALDIYWYQTIDEHFTDIPTAVESRILQEYYQQNGELPKWNIEI